MNMPRKLRRERLLKQIPPSEFVRGEFFNELAKFAAELAAGLEDLRKAYAAISDNIAKLEERRKQTEEHKRATSPSPYDAGHVRR
jgi:hypothetical protein